MCARPDVAHLAHCLPLLDRLMLTLELRNDWHESEPNFRRTSFPSEAVVREGKRVKC
jgi:hypothetical protein